MTKFTFDLTPGVGLKGPQSERKSKSAKPRGSNPPGARTKNEPPRIPWREETFDEQYTYQRPGVHVLEDTPALRTTVADALLDIALAHSAFHDALVKFHAIGQLPNSIIKDLPMKSKRYLKIYKARR
jgi:hypothetical protein